MLHCRKDSYLQAWTNIQERKRRGRKAPLGLQGSSCCHRNVGEDNHFNMWRMNGTLPFCCHYIVGVYFFRGNFDGVSVSAAKLLQFEVIFLVSWSEAFQNKASFSFLLCFISEVPNRIRFWRLRQKPLELRKDKKNFFKKEWACTQAELIVDKGRTNWQVPLSRYYTETWDLTRAALLPFSTWTLES